MDITIRISKKNNIQLITQMDKASTKSDFKRMSILGQKYNNTIQS